MDSPLFVSPDVKVTLFVSPQAKETLFTAVNTREIYNVSKLLTSDNIDEHIGPYSSTPLCIACENLDINMIKLLLKRGANPNITSKYESVGIYIPNREYSSRKPLHSTHSPLMVILQTYKEDDFYNIPVFKMILVCINLLLEAGADITYTNKYGLNAYIITGYKPSHISPIISKLYMDKITISNVKNFVYRHVLKYGIPQIREKIKFKLSSFATHIGELLCTEPTTITNLSSALIDFLGITDDSQISRIQEYINM